MKFNPIDPLLYREAFIRKLSTITRRFPGVSSRIAFQLPACTSQRFAELRHFCGTERALCSESRSFREVPWQPTENVSGLKTRGGNLALNSCEWRVCGSFEEFSRKIATRRFNSGSEKCCIVSRESDAYLRDNRIDDKIGRCKITSRYLQQK